MSTVAVVLPTIRGREDHFERCFKAYADRSEPDATSIYVEHDHPSCGAAWVAGAKRASEKGFDYLHFTADDLEPHDGWLKAAIETVDAGYIPAPLVFNRDGSLDSAGLQGFGQYRGVWVDWQMVEGTTVPFLTREMWEGISATEGVSSLLADTHYATDLLISAAGRRLGWETVIRVDMKFTHYVAPAGRNHDRAPSDIAQFITWTAACAS